MGGSGTAATPPARWRGIISCAIGVRLAPDGNGGTDATKRSEAVSADFNGEGASPVVP